MRCRSAPEIQLLSASNKAAPRRQRASVEDGERELDHALMRPFDGWRVVRQRHRDRRGPMLLRVVAAAAQASRRQSGARRPGRGVDGRIPNPDLSGDCRRRVPVVCLGKTSENCLVQVLDRQCAHASIKTDGGCDMQPFTVVNGIQCMRSSPISPRSAQRPSWSGAPLGRLTIGHFGGVHGDSPTRNRMISLPGTGVQQRNRHTTTPSKPSP